MITAQDFDALKIPVSEEWKQRLAKNIARAATFREGSWSAVKISYGRSVKESVVAVCDLDMRELVCKLLAGSWNESVAFAEARKELVP